MQQSKQNKKKYLAAFIVGLIICGTVASLLLFFIEKRSVPSKKITQVESGCIAIDKTSREDSANYNITPSETNLPPQYQNKNKSRKRNVNVVKPPQEDTIKGCISPFPERTEEYGCGYPIMERDAECPGGNSAWIRFLQKNLRYPDDAVDYGIEGTVLVRFAVDMEGNISDVEAIRGPIELRKEAVRVVKRSSKWIPATSHGRTVTSYKTQPITFRLASD